MTDPISRWVADETGTPVSQWTSNRFYRYALERGISDPLVVANARALLDLVEDFSTKHPSVPFDRIVEAVIAGMDPELTLTYYAPGLRKLALIKWRHAWTSFRRSPYAAIKKMLSGR